MKHLILLVITLFTASCTISTPLRDKRLEGRKSLVVVAVTNAILKPGREKGLFFKYSKEILEKLPNHKGYLGGSIRREVFGNEAWTLTVWESEAALQNFVMSGEHLNAMYMAEKALLKMRQIHFVEGVSEKIDWSLALKKIDPIPFKTFKAK